jgi:transglutaminase-like putative cysteine protease
VAGQIHKQQLQLWPSPQVGHWRQDLWNNWVYQAWFAHPVEQLTVVNRLRYRPKACNPFDFVVDKSALHYPPEWDPSLECSLGPYLEIPERLAEWLAPWRSFQGTSLALAIDLNQQVSRSIGYEIRLETGVQSALQTLSRGIGSCRDTAWLVVLALRSLGYPARFVSGYWFQVDSRAAELHAWAEFYLPGAGWLGLDPTAGLLVGQQHVALARAPRPDQVPPISGSHAGATAECEFRVRVRKQA